jgi:hypothetical protein
MHDKIYHISNPTKQHTINIGTGKIIQVESGNPQSLIFIVNYMNFYSDKVDEEFDHPIADAVSIKELFGEDIAIYTDLIPTDNETKNKDNIKHINNIVEIATELKLYTLLDKLAIILYFYMC